jgi:hypothetical protein
VNKLLAAKQFGFNKLNQSQVASSSWSSLKNATAAASTTTTTTALNATRDDTDASSEKSGAFKNADAFHKFRMQMKEKQMKEPENLKSLKEKEQVMSK